MFHKFLLTHLLKRIEKSSSRLALSCTLSSPSKETKSCINLPSEFFCSLDFRGKFCDAFHESGFDGVNVGITDLLDGGISANQLQIENIPIVSFHGTSIKKALSANSDYVDILKKDLLVLQTNRIKEAHINYDLYSGHGPELKFFSSFYHTAKVNLINTCKKLTLNEGKNQLYDYLKYMIDCIDEVYNGTGHTIYLEIPGSKGWSMQPEVTESTMEIIYNLIQETQTPMKICLDVGHMMTWIPAKGVSVDLGFLSKYRSKLGMFHISSASSGMWEFVLVYYMTHFMKYPLWHIRGLDLHLAIHEKYMLHIVKIIRKAVGSQGFIEVCELKIPSHTVSDYFPKIQTSFIDDSMYYQHLKLQSKILGYQ